MRKLVTLLSIAAFAATTGDRSLMDAVKQGDTAAALSMLKHDAVALFWPFAAVSHQAHFDLVEIGLPAAKADSPRIDWVLPSRHGVEPAARLATLGDDFHDPVRSHADIHEPR